MRKRILIACLLLTALVPTFADEITDAVDKALSGLDVRVPKITSPVIKQMYIGLDATGAPKTGVAIREIESFNFITAVVVVDKTDKGYVLREVAVPDARKMRKPDERRDLLKLVERFKNVPFDPHAEKSAVDTVSGATRYSVKMTSYLNYLARKTALKMEEQPDWPKKQ